MKAGMGGYQLLDEAGREEELDDEPEEEQEGGDAEGDAVEADLAGELVGAGLVLAYCFGEGGAGGVDGLTLGFAADELEPELGGFAFFSAGEGLGGGEGFAGGEAEGFLSGEGIGGGLGFGFEEEVARGEGLERLPQAIELGFAGGFLFAEAIGLGGGGLQALPEGGGLAGDGGDPLARGVGGCVRLGGGITRGVERRGDVGCFRGQGLFDEGGGDHCPRRARCEHAEGEE